MSATIKQELVPGRVRSLDGLRGVAAMAVLFSHLVMLSPILAQPAADGLPIGSASTLEWWLVHSPLHILWEGTGAVFIFFVLSGIVLTLPVLRSRNFSWKSYFPQRLIRLYLPVWAAVCFTVLTFVLVPRENNLPLHYLENRPHELSTIGIFKDLTLLAGHGQLNTPLWSLRWEILFSLLLPLYVWFVVRFRRHSLLVVGFCLGLVVVGEYLISASMIFLPMFLIGAVMAARWRELETFANYLNESATSKIAWFSITAAGVFLLGSYWLVMLLRPSPEVLRMSGALTLVGAIALVYVAAFCPSVQRFLSGSIPQWMGLVSFSLYLTHEPIVMALAFHFGTDQLALVIPTSMLVSLIVAQLFFKFVEKPSHQLSKHVKARFSDQPNIEKSVISEGERQEVK